MTKEQAQSKLDALVQAKVDEALQPMREEVVKSRRERVEWFKGGYQAGLQDNPEDKNPAGKPFTLEQRIIKAAAAYAITQNNKK